MEKKFLCFDSLLTSVNIFAQTVITSNFEKENYCLSIVFQSNLSCAKLNTTFSFLLVSVGKQKMKNMTHLHICNHTLTQKNIRATQSKLVFVYLY